MCSLHARVNGAKVFTTLSADDIDLTRTNAGGAVALKTFLTYAATGKIDIPLQTERAQDLVFEEQVLGALQKNGYTVHAQVGCAGFFLDLAAVDDRRPGRYLLGIECDGSRLPMKARSARDRDRLRQAVLEGLNWQIHRVWSTDWFRNPQRELDKVIEVVERAKEHLGRQRLTGPRRPTVDSEDAEDAPQIPGGTVVAAAPPSLTAIPKYKTADLHIGPLSAELHLLSSRTLSQWLVDVVAIESPVFWMEAARRVTSAARIQRLGNRIQDAFRSACQERILDGPVRSEGRVSYGGPTWSLRACEDRTGSSAGRQERLSMSLQRRTPSSDRACGPGKLRSRTG